MKRLVTIASLTAAMALSAAGAASAADVYGATGWSHANGSAAWGASAWSHTRVERGSKPKLERGSHRLRAATSSWN